MRYIALLRGINVTGNNMIKMTELKAVFEKCGFENVVTYINSGNLAFDVRTTTEPKLIAKIEKRIAEAFELTVSVMIREQREIDAVLANNPFNGKYESHKQMHVLFLREEIPDDKLAEALSFQTDREKIVVRGREIYALLLDGVAESQIGRGLIERRLKIPITARNWRTVEKLAEI
ncbi:MAG: DUF1697 domain-containing protein, partial [Pyrinomonadaceae bacterium]